MTHILLIGAGKSSSYLIDFLLNWRKENEFGLTIADSSVEHLTAIFGSEIEPFTTTVEARDKNSLRQLIQGKTLVISLLPASMHADLVPFCLESGSHLLTASYVSAQMQSYDNQAKERGILLLNECGLDPGLDHLSAMQLLDRLRGEGCEILGFESYCGGLVAPECDDNPWGYKFSWNPRNVVLAGQGGLAKFRQNGLTRYLPYHRLFENAQTIEIENYGKFDAYPNRDSLAYSGLYGLDTALTLIRGTLRKEGFCRAWHVFVYLGLTDDTTPLDCENLSYRQWIESYTDIETLRKLAGSNWDKFEWLELFSEQKIGLRQATSAQILQQLLEQKWLLKPYDRDMIVMQHIINYREGSILHKYTSSLVVEGKDSVFTAMAKTVGLPLGVMAKMVLDGIIARRGVVIPVYSEFYQPSLAKLQQMGIAFTERKN